MTNHTDEAKFHLERAQHHLDGSNVELELKAAHVHAMLAVANEVHNLVQLAAHFPLNDGRQTYPLIDSIPDPHRYQIKEALGL